MQACSECPNIPPDAQGRPRREATQGHAAAGRRPHADAARQCMGRPCHGRHTPFLRVLYGISFQKKKVLYWKKWHDKKKLLLCLAISFSVPVEPLYFLKKIQSSPNFVGMIHHDLAMVLRVGPRSKKRTSSSKTCLRNTHRPARSLTGKLCAPCTWATSRTRKACCWSH